VSKFSQGHRVPSAQGIATLTRFRASIVPAVWVLTRSIQSRIFQQLAVPDILKKVLKGVPVTYKLQGTYQPRDYCVQYRESDFNFASRLMEEEGIYYFFTHADGSHQMIVADTPQGHADVPGPTTVIFEELEGGGREEDRIHGWEKTQELRSGKYRLWDSCFELPGKNLEAVQPVLATVQVGTVSHNLKVANNDQLEIYDYPGGYAQRFDGVAPGGGDRASDIQKIFDDNKRTASIRMQQEAALGLRVVGTSTCRHFVAGCKFTLDRHFDADGAYVLTRVEHFATVGDAYTTGNDTSKPYTNQFECIPAALPFKPPRETPRPRVEGTQTAIVVGALPVEQIFTDKYGRVKVQFFWDREGKFDAESSCWIRVSTAWAGKGWGQINIPRIGHEVIVDFLEGDPDQPIILGSVYNADNMPAKKLPDGRKTSGLVSRTNEPGPGYNQITCDDTKDKEMIIIHGQYDMSTTIEHDQTLLVKNDRTDTVQGKHTETITKDTAITIDQGNLEHKVNTGTADYYVKSDLTEKYDSNQNTTVTASLTTTVGNNIDIEAKSGYIHIKGATEIQLLVGSSKLLMQSNGSIQLSGVNVTIDGSESVTIHGASVTSKADTDHNTTGAIVMSSGTATNTVKGGMVMLNP